jgi:type I restriction enzyme M protein
MTEPYHIRQKATEKGFDYIVSNPPFGLDFSDWRDSVDASRQTIQEGENEEAKKLYARFFAGVPNIPKKKKDSMAIYLLFIQHIISSLNNKGKAAVVVPTGFLTEGKGKAKSIVNKIRMSLVDKGWLRAVISMPSNIFATTGTSVSIIFIDKTNKTGAAVLVDASNLGTKIKDGKNQKTLLSGEEEQKIIDAVNGAVVEDGFSVVKTFDELKTGKYSFNPGGYFDVSTDYANMTSDEFLNEMNDSKARLEAMFAEGRELETQIFNSIERLTYE